MARLEVRGDEIRLQGTIDRSTGAAFARMLADPAGRDVRVLRIDSTGGDARASIVIANLVHDRGLDLVVERICGSACAAYLLPAAKRARFEPGAMINLHHMPSPLMREIGLAALSRSEAGASDATLPTRYSQGMNRLIDHQRSFYQAIGVAAAPMESIMDVWVELHQRLTDLKKPVNADRISFVPDDTFVQNCLGLRNVLWRDFEVADTVVMARRGDQPQAFLIRGFLYFEGERLSDRDFSCPRR